MVGYGRARQGTAVLGRAGQGRAGLGRAGQGRAVCCVVSPTVMILQGMFLNIRNVCKRSDMNKGIKLA